MSLAYQRWEIGGASSVCGYNKITGSPQVHQYGSEGLAVLRRQQQQQHPHEPCNLSPSFSMFVQQCPGAAGTATTNTTTTTGVDGNRFHIQAAKVKASASSLSSPQQTQAAVSVHWEMQADASSKQAMPTMVTSTLSLSDSQERTEEEQRWGMKIGGTHKLGTTRLLNGTAQYYNGAQPGRGLSLMMKPANKEATAEECSSPALQKAESTRLTNVLPGTVHEPQCVNLEPPCSPSSSSSFICDRRDQQSCCSSEDDTSGDAEAQSAYSGPLNQMSTLESSLPIKRPGLSKFFGGKSRSFSSLADVSSVSDLAKPNNPYAKRRRMKGGGGLSASLDRHRSYPPLSRTSVAGISKKPITNRSSSTLTIAVKLGGLTKEDKDFSSAAADLPSCSSRIGLSRTTPSRSFSLTDLPVVSNPSFPPFERSFARP